MELDGYCDKLKVAFEYHGQQHYRYVKLFHADDSDLAIRQEDDALKRRLCETHGILLIEVPFDVPIDQLPFFIKEAIAGSKRDFALARLEDVAVASYVLPKKLSEMQELAQSKGGKCLSDGYIGSNSKLTWQCLQGHIWKAKPAHIKAGVWCPHCSGKARLSIEEMREIASSRGGECLSEEYLNIKTNLMWRCAHGHEWKATPRNVKSGRWCPVCGGSQKSSIDQMVELAKSKGGICVSTVYINDRTKLRWRCSENHEWDAVPNSIKSGSWCPECSKRKVRATRRNNLPKT